MKVREPLSDRIFDIVNYLLLILSVLICLYPLLYILFASLSEPEQLMAHRGGLIAPLGFSLDAFKIVLSNSNIATGYQNTLIYVVVGTSLNLVMTTIGAYALSIRNFLWKKAVMSLIVFTMFFGGGLIPTFLLVQDLGLYNTRWALILPGAISTWNMIVMKTYFQSIPESLHESAKIDGANDLRILGSIVLPLSAPIIAVMVLFYGVAHWNQYFNALIYLRNRDYQPIQTFLREILIANQMDGMSAAAGDSSTNAISATIKYATIMVATVPILAIYPFLQKYFIKGVMVGAIKG